MPFGRAHRRLHLVHLPAAVGGLSVRQKNLLDRLTAASSFATMNRGFAEIADEALMLPRGEQLKLVRTLLERVEARGDLQAETAWEEEIERRIHLIDNGLAKGRPFSEVLRDIDDRFGK